MFLTSFSFSTIVANFKKKDGYAEFFDAKFEQQNSCARCSGQVLHCQQKTLTSSKPLVAQSVYSQISSHTTVAHGVLDKFYLFNNSRKPQEKRQLCRVFWGQFRETEQLRTVFYTSFTFRTMRVNLNQNDSCAEWLKANFKQQHGCARCFLQVSSKTANQISWILLTTHTNFSK